MNNLGDLIKVNLIEDFKLNTIFKNKSIFKIILTIIILTLFLVSMLFVFGFIYYTSLMAVSPGESVKTLTMLVLTSSSIVLIISNLTSVGPLLFKSNDFDLLMSMPISTKEIVLSKIFSLLLKNYFTILFTSIPAYIVMGLNVSIRPAFYFEFSLALLFLPLLIIAVMSLISYLLNIIFNKIKIKSFLQISLGIIAISLYMFFVMGFSSGEETYEMWVVLFNKLKYVYPVVLLAVNGLHGNPLLLLFYILINIISFILFISIISKVYLKVNTGVIKSNNKNTLIVKQKKLQSNVITVLKFEFKKYFSNVMYVLNTIIGKILFLVICLVIYFSSREIQAELVEIESFLSLFIIGIGLFTLTMNATTSSTISLEGKNIWFYKSLPLKSSEIFIGKILVDLILTLIIGIPTIIIISVLFKFNLLITTLLILFVLLISILNSSIGLLINLKYPKLDWDLEIKAIKQSLSVFLHIAFSFLLTIVIIALSVLYLKFFINIELLILLINMFILLLGVIVILVIKIKGDSWFLKL